MNYVGRLFQGFKDYYNEINPATLTGAIDVVVVQQEDGSFKSSPFHVRFGKLGVLRSREKIVDIEINGEPVEDLHMELGEAGEAYFVEKIDGDDLGSSTDSLTGSKCFDIDLKESITTTTTSNGVDEPVTKAVKETVLNIHLTDSSTIYMSNSADDTLTTAALNAAQDETMTSKAITSGSDNDINKINFFSDGELTPELTSPIVSRPTTPKSDTEVETSKTRRPSNKPDMSNQWNWNWGQLPERQTSTSHNSNHHINPSITVSSTEQNEQSIESTNDNNNTRKQSSSSSKNLSQQPQYQQQLSNSLGGIYLDETDKLDSEVAELYLNQKSDKNSKEKSRSKSPPQLGATTRLTTKTNSSEYMELGNDQLLPQTPLRSYSSILGDIQISLCGLNNPPVVSNNNNFNSPALPTVSANNSNMLSSKSQLSLNSSMNSLQSKSNSDLNLLSTSPPSPLPSSSSISLQTSPATKSNTTLVANTLLAESNSNSSSAQMSYEDLFQQHIVPFEKFFDEITTIVSNPNLVVKINNRYMSWQSASPIVLAALVYQRTLPNETINMLVEKNSANKASNEKEKEAAQQSKSNKSYWFWSKKPSNQDVDNKASQQQSTLKANETMKSPSSMGSKSDYEIGMMLDEELAAEGPFGDRQMLNEDGTKKSVQRQLSEKHNHHHHHHHNHDPNYLTGTPLTSLTTTTVTQKVEKHKREYYKKTTRLSSDLIEKLNLKPGSNEIQYSVTTALQGTTRITSYIFLWNYDDKVIVSDIDGTITKSDVWGQVLPMLGRDWSQAGVADLFTAIEKNEYKFMYLSARAIGQSKITRDLLRNINQDGFTLPKGPLLVTPTSLFTAFQKEVIEKKPQEFKISCLKDIQSLFPLEQNPYYAGYGNKSTDVVSYRAVGIPVPRIFTINPQGEVKHEVSQSFQSSYSKLCDYVDLIFPPYKTARSDEHIKQDFKSFTYWRSDPIQMDDDLMKELENAVKETMLAEKPSSVKEKEAKLNAAALNQQQQQQQSANGSSLIKRKSSLTTSASVSFPLMNLANKSTTANNKNNDSSSLKLKPVHTPSASSESIPIATATTSSLFDGSSSSTASLKLQEKSKSASPASTLVDDGGID